MTDYIDIKKIREAVYENLNYSDWDKEHTYDETIMQDAYQRGVISHHLYNAYLHSIGNSLTVDELKWKPSTRKRR